MTSILPAAPRAVLLHGLGRTARSMRPVERVLATRGYLALNLGYPSRTARIVLPGTPIVGPLYRQFAGPAGLELGTMAHAIPPRLPAVPFELSVIAGDRSVNPFFSALLGAPNDGKVRVDRARVAGMRDFIVVRSWHPLLMASRAVVDQTLHFLERGACRR